MSSIEADAPDPGVTSWSAVESIEQPELSRPDHRLRPVGHHQLGEQVADVTLHGVDGDEQLLGDHPVGMAGGQQPQDLVLAGAQRLHPV